MAEIVVDLVDEDSPHTYAGHLSVGVQNVAPSLRITGPASGSIYAAGESVNLAAIFADPGVLDSHDSQWTISSIMRPGEVVIMRGCDIDRSGKVWIYKPAYHKTEHHGHAWAISLGSQAQKIVSEHLKLDLSAYLFSPQEAEASRLSPCRSAFWQASSPDGVP